MNSKVTQVILVVFGAISTLLLLFRSQGLNSNEPTGLDYCELLFGSSCDSALTSNASWNLSFPVVSLGLMYFGIVGILLMFEKQFFQTLLSVILSFGTGISIFQVYYLFSNSIACPLCYFIHLIILSILILNIRNIIKQVKDRKYLKRILWICFISLLIGTLCEAIVIEKGLGSRISVIMKNSISRFKSSPQLDINISSHEQFPCDKDAKVNIVVFSSYECPACQDFDKSLNQIIDKFGKNICVHFKHFPLSSQCNPQVEYNMQPNSCLIAKAVISAGLQGKFDAFHNAVFNSNYVLDSIQLSKIAESLNLNLVKWKLDLDSDVVESILSSDIEYANKIGISSTPSIFINGRKLDNRPGVLYYIIKDIVNDN